MNRPVYILFFLLFLGTQAFTQEKGKHVKKVWRNNISSFTTPIANLNSTNFSDLQFLKNLVQDKKYVFIGESSHQIEEFYQFRARLINFLISELGFTVVAFEHEKVLCVEPNKIKDKINLDSLLSFYYNPNMVNSLSKGANSLMNVISDSEVKTTGFDILISSTKPNRFRIITQNYFPFIPDSVFVHDSLFFCQKFDIHTLVNEWNTVISKIKIDSSDKIALEVKKNLENRVAWFSIIPNVNQDKRDSLMAENIIWLIENIYPKEKIIFLAHNEHINKLNFNYTRMGELIPDTILNNSYVLGLTAYQGKTGLLNGQTVTLPKNRRNSLESILNSTNYDIVFCDFSKQILSKKNSWMFEKVKRQSRSKSNGYIIPYKFYDGVIQIKKVNATIYD